MIKPNKILSFRARWLKNYSTRKTKRPENRYSKSQIYSFFFATTLKISTHVRITLIKILQLLNLFSFH